MVGVPFGVDIKFHFIVNILGLHVGSHAFDSNACNKFIYLHTFSKQYYFSKNVTGKQSFISHNYDTPTQLEQFNELSTCYFLLAFCLWRESTCFKYLYEISYFCSYWIGTCSFVHVYYFTEKYFDSFKWWSWLWLIGIIAVSRVGHRWQS